MNKPIRRAQAIVPFGVGSVVTFQRGESFIVAGLDSWFKNDDGTPIDKEEFLVTDERLRTRLNIDKFYQPPDFRTEGQNSYIKIPLLRFPRTHYCKKCGTVREENIEFQDRSRPRCTATKCEQKANSSDRKTPELIQVRFVAACENGHLQDFPWREWVHKGQTDCQGQLRFIQGRTASLAGVRIKCEGCNRLQTLARAYDEKALDKIHYNCKGHKPWLSQGRSLQSEIEPCDASLRLILRAASNLYFPVVMSSIYLPNDNPSNTKEIREEINKIELLNPSVYNNILRRYRHDKLNEDVIANFQEEGFLDKNFSAQILHQAFLNKFNDMEIKKISETMSEVDFRRPEYTMLSNGLHTRNENLEIEVVNISKYDSQLHPYFDSVSLVKRLKETRSLYGFTRVKPHARQTPGELRRILSRAPEEPSWLPAAVVRGEGIFLKFKEEKITEWRAAFQIDKRVQRAIQGYHSAYISGADLGVKFFLLHTFAHLMINRLIYECGYAAASLKERIYCSQGEKPMAGILIYTAAGDSEGTLGGLVQQGIPTFLEPIITRALESALWCSTDPICIGSNGQGPDSCNLAACHSCALLPETSCEVGNRLLDRGVIIGTLAQPDCGFFSSSVRVS